MPEAPEKDASEVEKTAASEPAETAAEADEPTAAEAEPAAAADEPASETPKKLPSTFGIKDLFTCVNILGGVASVIFCIEGELRWAGYAALLGYFVGDSLDGLVARATNTGNAFGAQFDQAGDMFTQSIVPATMIYVAYRPLSAWLGAALASLLIITGTVRHARGAVKSPDFPMCYFGMPRTVSAFLVMSYLLSSIVAYTTWWPWPGVALIVFVSFAHILPMPFRTHKGRRLKMHAKVMILGFFTTTSVALFAFTKYVFDVSLFWFTIYSIFGWLELDRDEMVEFRRRARQWAAEVRAAR